MWDGYAGGFVPAECSANGWPAAPSDALYRVLEAVPESRPTLHQAVFTETIPPEFASEAATLFAYLLHVHVLVLPMQCNVGFNVTAAAGSHGRALVARAQLPRTTSLSVTGTNHALALIPLACLGVYVGLLRCFRQGSSAGKTGRRRFFA